MIGGSRADHLGDRLSALVDGQLDHADRDRVLAHLARCPDCRWQAAEQRALKARLDRLDVRAPGGLESRLLALPVASAGLPAAQATPGPAWQSASPRQPASATRQSESSSARFRAPTAALGALLLVGVGMGMVRADGPGAPQRDPGQAGLVAEHVNATTRVPLADPGVVGATWTGPQGSAATAPGVRLGTSPSAGLAVPVAASTRGR